jgi:type I restriction enzyme S subunit
MSDLSIPGLGVWPTEPLGSLCDIVIGRTPSRNRPELWNGEHPWLSIADMNQGSRIRTTKEKITSFGVSESGSRLIPIGTVLLSFKLSIGKVAVTEIDTYTNEAIAALPILDTKKLRRDFLYWTLRSIRLDEEVDVAAKGKTLNKAKLERLAIPLPPPEEQRRIAAVLDKADALRRQRQESLQLTEKLLQSVFIDMFGDPATNPKGLPECSIGNLLVSANYGTSAKASSEGTWPVLRMGNITYEGGWDFSSLKYMELDPKEERKYLVRNGEILFNRTNSRDLVGKTAVYRESKPMAFAGYLIRCTVNDEADPEYISAYLNSAHGKKILRSMCKSIVGMANINAKELQSITILKPPVALQKKFGEAVRAILSLRTSVTAASKIDEVLFGSLQQRAFRDELDLSRLMQK